MSDKLPNWIDGAQLVPWLACRLGLPVAELSGFVGRRWETRIHRWKKGVVVKVETVDELLCEFDVCLGEVPDEFYCRDPRAGKAPHSPVSAEDSARIARLRSLGWTVREVAAMVGATRRTVERHSRKAAAA